MQAQRSIQTSLPSDRLKEPRPRGRAPLVSVCMPSFNHASFLATAVESVLKQTYPHVELIIVDDGSTDKSLEIAQGYASRYPGRVSVYTHDGHAHRGVSATANLAFERSGGDYWCGLSSDDAFVRDKVERQVTFLGEHPEIGLVHGPATVIDAEGRRVGLTFARDLSREPDPLLALLEGNYLHPRTVMLRRECLEQVGLRDENLEYDDWELWVRIAAHYKMAFLPGPVAYYRIHTTNTPVGQEPEFHRDRSLDVMQALEAKTFKIGGGLVRPFNRAMIQLQLAYLYFCAADLNSAHRAMKAAFEIEPDVLFEYRFLAGWLVRRQREVPMFTRSEARDYIGWFTAYAAGLIPADTRRTGALDPIWRLKFALLLGRYGFVARQLLRRGELILDKIKARQQG